MQQLPIYQHSLFTSSQPLTTSSGSSLKILIPILVNHFFGTLTFFSLYFSTQIEPEIRDTPSAPCGALLASSAKMRMPCSRGATLENIDINHQSRGGRPLLSSPVTLGSRLLDLQPAPPGRDMSLSGNCFFGAFRDPPPVRAGALRKGAETAIYHRENCVRQWTHLATEAELK